MKKILYPLMAVAAVGLASCQDDTYNLLPDDPDLVEGREHMSLFLHDHNTGQGTDPSKSSYVDKAALNTIYLSWTAIDGCAGYHIRVCNAQSVLGHPENWLSDTYLTLDTIMKPDQQRLVLENLEYSQDYYFSIRTLSEKARRADGSIDMDSPYHSKWFGHGSTSQWADYYRETTEARYDVPDVVSFSEKTETSVRMTFDLNVATAGLGDATKWEDHFQMDNGKFVADEVHAMVSTSNPTAEFNDPKFTYNNSLKRYVYKLTAQDIANGYVDIVDLSPNSAYVLNLYNSQEKIYVDAVYNTISPRTAGQVGEPIRIEWLESNVMADTIKGAQDYKCSRIDTIMANYMKDPSLAEGTIFELDGGKAYYLYNNTDITKGFTLRTRQEDAEKGLRAKVYLSGIDLNGLNPRTSNWVFGKAKASGEADAPIFVDDVIFENIDFDVPMALNYQDQEAGVGNACGNYFANMYSSGLAVTFNSFQIKNCSFQGLIRGFIRTQGSKRKTFNKILFENNVWWNCMSYNAKAQGYCWIASDGTPNTGVSNVFKECIVRNNTIVDCPNNSFFNDNNKNNPYPTSVTWNIEFDHNTIINFNTTTASAIFGMRYIPAGSQYKITNNLFIVAKELTDERTDHFGIADFRNINGEPANEIFFEVHDNYGMSWDPNRQGDDKVFTTMGLSSKSNTVGKFLDYKFNGGPAGSAMHPDNDLVVRAGTYPLLPTELMPKVNPTPQSKDKEANRMKHRRNVLDLYYNTDSKVTGHEIYQKNIGDYRWKVAPRETWNKTTGMPAGFHALGMQK